MRAFWLITLLLAACEGDYGQVELIGSTMGTQFSIKLPQGIGDHDALVLQKSVEATLAQVDQIMSTYLPDSELSRFNANTTTDWQEVSAEFCFSVEETLTLSELTNGSFDITVAPLVNLWGFGPGEIIDEPPADEHISAMLESVGYQHLQADCSAPALRKNIAELTLDMSAFGKGYATDRVAAFLDKAGFDSFLVEIGGELRLRGLNAENSRWAIGIEEPLPNHRSPYMILRLSDTALATSGDYRNYFEADGKRYSHTIDPRSGRPVAHSLASVTVVTDSGHRADSLATALLVMGPENGMGFATEREIAALFLVRNDAGIEQKSTPAFDLLLQQN